MRIWHKNIIKRTCYEFFLNGLLGAVVDGGAEFEVASRRHGGAHHTRVVVTVVVSVPDVGDSLCIAHHVALEAPLTTADVSQKLLVGARRDTVYAEK